MMIGWISLNVCSVEGYNQEFFYAHSPRNSLNKPQFRDIQNLPIVMPQKNPELQQASG